MKSRLFATVLLGVTFAVIGCGQVQHQTATPIPSSPGNSLDVQRGIVLASRQINITLKTGLQSSALTTQDATNIGITVPGQTALQVTADLHLDLDENATAKIAGTMNMKVVSNEVIQMQQLGLRVRLLKGNGLTGSVIDTAVIPLTLSDPHTTFSITSDNIMLASWDGPFREAVVQTLRYSISGQLAKAIAQNYTASIIVELVGVPLTLPYVNSCISPSGLKIAYLENSGLKIFDLSTHITTSLPFFPASLYFDKGLKFYDDNQLIFGDNNSLKKIDLTTMTLSTLTTSTADYLLFLQKGPSQKIYYYKHYYYPFSPNEGLYAADLNDFAHETPIDRSYFGTLEQVLSPDGQTLYFASGNMIIRKNLANQNQDIIYEKNLNIPDSNFHGISNISLSNKGDQLVIKQEQYGTYLHDINQHATHWIFPGGTRDCLLGFDPITDQYIYVAAPPRGFLANETPQHDFIYKYNIDNNTIENLTTPGITIWHDGQSSVDTTTINLLIANSPYQQLYADVAVKKLYASTATENIITNQLLTLTPSAHGFSYINQNFAVYKRIDSPGYFYNDAWEYQVTITLKDTQLHVLKTYQEVLNPDPSYVSQRNYTQTSTQRTVTLKMTAAQVDQLLQPGQLKAFILRDLVTR